MKKLKIVTVVGTRPEIIRLSRVISKLDKFCDHKLVHTGQNYDYELNNIFFEDLNIRKPDKFLSASGKNAAETIANVITKTDEFLSRVKPNAFLVLGDTNSCLAALSAKKRKIPIFHMEAGNRCFDMRVPEETNRKIVDHIADINLTYSSIAREYLLKEGFASDQIIKTGSPMNEVLTFYRDRIDNSNALEEHGLEKNNFFLLSCHREENIESEANFKKFIKILNGLSTSYNKDVILSTHPRTLKKIKQSKVSLHNKVRLLKPLSFSDYNNLQINSKCVLSDSGTISEESSILNFPALNIREAHERPEAMEEGSVIMTGLDFDIIKNSIDLIQHQSRDDHRTINLVNDYVTQNVSEKVLRIILSYTDYVRRNVWKEY
tara:strand:- start:6374 stop:7504 length:1131 start_codon:yes stop_codon:yes gene_type:complete